MLVKDHMETCETKWKEKDLELDFHFGSENNHGKQNNSRENKINKMDAGIHWSAQYWYSLLEMSL